MTKKNTDDLLNPKNNPDSPIGVKRVNNMPLIIIGVGIGIFLFVIMLVGMDRAEKQNEANNPAAADRKIRDSYDIASSITKGRNHGFIEPNIKENKPLEITPEDDEVSPEVARIIDSNNVGGDLTKKTNVNDYQQQRNDEINRRISEAHLRKFELSAYGASSVSFDTPKVNNTQSNGTFAFDNGSSNRENKLNQLQSIRNKLMSTNARLESADPMAAYKAKLASLSDSGLTNQLTNQGEQPAEEDYSSFNGSDNRWSSSARMEAPTSPFELRAGFVIPATMISGINSDLPGQIMAQVSQNVFDTATGNHLLIPLGSRLVGGYSSQVAFGQERVMVAWQRIIFPDGKALDIGSMSGADSAGYAGYADQVNHHFLRVFGSAIMMSFITAGVELSQDDSGDLGDKKTASSAMSEALGQQLGQATSQMIMKNLNIAPTIEIRPGYRFNVMVNKDLTFNTPYKSFDY